MFETFRYLKNKFEANRATQGNAFTYFSWVWKNFWGDGVKPPSPTRALPLYIATIDSHFLCSRYRNFLCISRLFHIHYRMKEDIWAIVLVLDIKIKILQKYISNNSHLNKNLTIMSHLLEHQLTINRFLNFLQTISPKTPEKTINSITLNTKDIFVNYWRKNVR